MVEDLKKGGSFLLNCSWDLDELNQRLPAKVKRFLAENDINFYTIDGIKIGKEIGLGGRINTILQAAFFNIAKIIPIEKAVEYMKDAATKSYGKKGEKVVAMNHAAIDRGVTDAVKVEIPADWKNAVDETVQEAAVEGRKEVVDFVNNILTPVNAQRGDALPVSAFVGMEDGTMPQGTAAYEKRGIAVDVPEWMPENCIQCNFCAYVCPHSVIRPIPMTEAEVDRKSVV